VHGTALKMFFAERAGDNLKEFPMRFWKLVKEEGVFAASGERRVDHCAAISKEQLEKFADLYPDFPKEKVRREKRKEKRKIFKFLLLDALLSQRIQSIRI
jgi:hypothetical protein